MRGPPRLKSFYPRPALYFMPVFGAGILLLLYVSQLTRTPTPATGSVQVAGSETMRPVVSACAEEFMTRNPRADIVVKGGGSGDGVASLLHGLVDVGMVSRQLSKRERDFAASKGMELVLTSLALDGVAVIVHRSNPVAALDLGQIRDIFGGKIALWPDVAGAGAEIVAFARAEGSGTASLFGERVLDGSPYAASVRRLPTNEAIVAEVAKRPGAVGYTGLGALRGVGDSVRVVPLRATADERPVPPAAETIRAGTYPLARTLVFGTLGPPAGPIKAFLDFCTGAGGRLLLQKAGYVVASQ